jgi:gamma-glutamyltranspeptidase/glutathione hydrolase
LSEQSSKYMIATSHPLAVEAGLEMMEAGGNTADAAVAAAAVLTVVDPRSTGIGGDGFALYWRDGMARPVGMASGGPAPSGLSVKALRNAGFEVMPEDGPWSVTVPGVVAGWKHLLDRFGTVSLDRALAFAISVAEQGFEVTTTIANDWNDSIEKLSRYSYSAEVYLRDGRAPRAGEHITNPELATSLRAIATEGPRVFYEGWIAERIEAAVRDAGGPLRAADLSDWAGPRWVSPISAAYRGVDVFEMPPPNHGVLALQALKLYEGVTTESPGDEEHAAIESLKLAFADAGSYVADPDFYSVPLDGLLDVGYLAQRRSLIDMDKAMIAEAGSPGDTVYLAVMKGNEGCSFIQSVYADFGSAVGVPGTGIILQNRGAGFVLSDDHPNRPEPGKRPYHTIIPAMLGRDGLWGCFGVVGGFMQPQGHLQVLRNLLDRGQDPASAVGSPRFRVLGGRAVAFEPAFDRDVVRALESRGHEAEELSGYEAGGGQLIVRTEDGFVGGSDPRKDGMVGGA